MSKNDDERSDRQCQLPISLSEELVGVTESQDSHEGFMWLTSFLNALKRESETKQNITGLYVPCCYTSISKLSSPCEWIQIESKYVLQVFQKIFVPCWIFSDTVDKIIINIAMRFYGSDLQYTHLQLLIGLISPEADRLVF